MAMTTPPYNPSYVDRIIDAIERSRYHPIFLYGGLYLIILAIYLGGSWLDGFSRPGVFTIDAFANSLWPVIALALIHYLDQQAEASAEKFRSVTGLDEDAFQSHLYKLVTMPARVVTILTTLAPILAIVFFLGARGPFPIVDRTIVGFLGFFLRFVPGFTFFPIVVYHTFRQLWRVSKFHALVERIDLFDREPLYAFSNLTSRTAIGWIIIISLNLLLTSTSAGTGFVPEGSFWWLLTGMEILLAVLAFLLPLIGMKQKLTNEKNNQLSQSDKQFKRAFQQLHEVGKSTDLEPIRATKDMITGLKEERAVIEAISVWPWRSATLRGFISAIFIPVLIRIILDLLESLL